MDRGRAGRLSCPPHKRRPSEGEGDIIRNWLTSLAVYRHPRVIAVLFLGFSSGLPLLLTLSTLSTWLATEGVSKTAIGLFAMVGLPYSLKFLWAPLVDRLPVPLLTRALGRRRGWALLTQLGLVASILGMGGSDPSVAPMATAAWALAVAFFSASQDIVIDAYRVELLEERQQGAGAAAIVFGYRIGMLAAGMGALYIASAHGWFAAYAVMAALMGVGIAAVLVTPEPRPEGGREADAREAEAQAWLAKRPHLKGTAARALAWLYGAVVAPFLDFARHRGWLLIVLFVLLYKFGDAVAGAMANPFYIELGFALEEIAWVSKFFGMGATFTGAFIGGVLVNRIGILRALLICGLLQAASNLVFAVQAAVGHDVAMLAVTVAAENISGGMGTAAFVAYLSSLCNVAYTATQYALLSSLMGAGRAMLASGSGWLADHMDWISFFVATTFLAVPGLVLLLLMMKWFPPRPAVAPAAQES